MRAAEAARLVRSSGLEAARLVRFFGLGAGASWWRFFSFLLLERAELQDTSRSSTAKAAPSTSSEAQLPLEPKSKGLDTDESKSSTSSEAKWPLETESKGLDTDASGSSASSLGATELGADVTTAADGTTAVVQASRRRRKSSKC